MYVVVSSEPSYFTDQPDRSHKPPSLGWPVQRQMNKVWVRNSRSPPTCPQKLGSLRARWSEWTCLLPLLVSVLLCVRAFQHQMWPGGDYQEAEGCSVKFVFTMTSVHAFSKATQVTMVTEFQEATTAWSDYGLWVRCVPSPVFGRPMSQEWLPHFYTVEKNLREE